MSETTAVPKPAGLAIGRIVTYRSRTGNYDVPAIVTATVDTLKSEGTRLFELSRGASGVPPLSSPAHVHLTVFTPGIPGQRSGADDFLVESAYGRSENAAGCYQEWDVEFFDRSPVPGLLEATEPAPGSWRWPERV